MCKVSIKYSLNNIFLTVSTDNKKILTISTGSYKKIFKGKSKKSFDVLYFMFKSLIYSLQSTLKKKKFQYFIIEFYGLTSSRMFFFKKYSKLLLLNFKIKNLFVYNIINIAFNGCKFKKSVRKVNKKKLKIFF